jgi:hypothetical protein
MGDDSRFNPIVRACVLALVAACSKSPGESSVLQASDLQGNGASFDANEIVDSASMQDQGALDEAAVLKFLQKTPYGGSSFLATYASHGTSAARAIAVASGQYALNPLVFLVRAQMDTGLIGSTTYPSPANRVEYAFGCGCIAPGQCDGAYAGFDVQIDCLGAALRESLDAVAATGKTDGGWGPRVTSTTLDGVSVTPKDDSTAALYQYTPVVAVGQAGGNWLFWNLWRKYASFAGYGGAKGAPLTSWIGDACIATSACVYAGTAGTCATQFPGGLCTLSCTGSCPTAMGEAQTFCADFGSQGGFCLAVCNQADPQCRTGYGCKSVAQAGNGSTSQYVCFPD